MTLGRPLSHYRKEVRCCSVTIRENIMQITAFSWGHLTLQSAFVTLQVFAAACGESVPPPGRALFNISDSVV